MQLLYAWELSGEDKDVCVTFSYFVPDWFGNNESERNKIKDVAFVHLEGTCQNLSRIDFYISKHSRGWELFRLPRVDLSILRLSVYSLLYQDQATSLVINEALELAKMYSGVESYRFINGVLDAIAKGEKEKI